MDLSIVIPVYNESLKISSDITAASEFLSEHGISGEIIVVDDGSQDKTVEKAEKTSVHQGVELKVIGYQEHTGKGYAVKTGILQTRGDMVMFIDSGSCVPYAHANRGVELVRDRVCEIAHGSRFLKESQIKRSQKPSRRLGSYLFRRFLRIQGILPGEITDSQCGLKIYEGGIARKLYRECFTEGFMFDIEIIRRTRSERYRIREFPIHWSSDPDSRLSLGKALPQVLSELRIIRKTLQ